MIYRAADLATDSSSLDLANLTGLGVGAVLLALVFRTLWRQEGGWRAVLAASREDAAAARADAAAARTDAAAARSDAAESRADARQARAAEAKCQRRMEKLGEELAAVRQEQTRHTRRLDSLDSGEHPTTD